MMILYSLIIRTADGMALSASTDFSNEVNKNIKESKRYVKLLAKKAPQFPDRCSLRVGSYSIHFITAIGITFLALCETNYPIVLAFSFLDELFKEFVTRYNSEKIREAKRPFSFIEFDSYIHKTRQRYNKPQSLSGRVIISDLSIDMRLNPPRNISLHEIEPPTVNGYRPYINLTRLTVGPPAKFSPLPWICSIPLIATLMMCGANFYRGVSALSEAGVEEDPTGPGTIHGILFLLETLLRFHQINLIFYKWRRRGLQSTTTLMMLCFLTWLLMDLKDSWLILGSIAVSVGMHVIIINRHLEPKLPDYNV